MKIRMPCVALLLGVFASVVGAMEPFRLHPDNPRYFLFRGKPTVLVTSGEHYGAVLNLDFDYVAYLDTLAADGLNHTRTFAGTYREIPGSFNITDNTLAPHTERFICPWARSDQPGYFDGGNKFDLATWDEAYFKRLRDFMAEASKRGIVVELTLFCPNYDEKLWKASPMSAANNVNGVGTCKRNDSYALKEDALTAVQEAVTRKLVAELKDFDNLYYEVCNEPYFGGVTPAWQNRIADVLVDAEKGLPARHLISMNIANGRARVKDPHPAVSLFNFHYCVPPDVVAMNRGLGKAIGENETGFLGKADVTYRTEGWHFLLAGGSLYNNLDYSFTPSHPRGDFLEYKSPGGGNPAFRRQLKVLKDFIHGLDFIRMQPDRAVFATAIPDGLDARALVEPGKAVAVYVSAVGGKGTSFAARWTGLLDPPVSGEYVFHAIAGDGVRLWVGGQKLLDSGADRGGTEETAKVSLEAGKPVEIRMEHYQGDAGTAARLLWTPPGGTKAAVPSGRLMHPDDGGKGLKAEYFSDRAMKKLRLVRAEPAVDFDWTSRSPLVRAEAGPAPVDLALDLSSGSYTAEWVNPVTGAVDKAERFDHAGGTKTIVSPPFVEDMALRVKRVGGR
jgi:hypothetical protein